MIPLLIIDPALSVPPYEQLRRQLAESVANGSLAPETKLPTVRRLAGDLGLSPNTIARAYQELEREGIIETRGRKGTFIAEVASAQESVESAARKFAAVSQQLGVDPRAALESVASALGLGNSAR